MSEEVVRPDFKGRSGLLDAVERLNAAIDQKDAELERLREENVDLKYRVSFLDNMYLEKRTEHADNIRLHRIEEAARKADEWAMTAGAGTGWGPMATIHEILRAALEEKP